MKIIGIDPGSAITGYAIVEQSPKTPKLLHFGSVVTDKKDSDASRLLELYNDLCQIMERFSPDKASVEKLFFCRNQKTIIPVAQARGIILAVLEKYKIPIYEYTPMQVKLSVTGYGKSTKNEVANMTQKLVDCEKFPKLDDTADAVALAVCHIRSYISV